MQAITLPARCDRAATVALYPELNDQIFETAVKVDAGRVEKIGQPMLQLLAAAARTEGGIEVTGASAAFVEAVMLAKLGETLVLGEIA